MPVSVDEFVVAATESGIVPPEQMAACLEVVGASDDTRTLANRLVLSGRLTAFQAQHLVSGRAASLVLGPYVLVDRIARGGMGHVYKAEHRKMRRTVALKVIATEALATPTAVRRFEQEVQVAARLHHPNVVAAYDAGEAAGTHYLVMEFVDGTNLARLVGQHGPQPLTRVVEWVLQAAAGLDYAHSRGVVHRDVKPGNLLLDSRGTVKVLDLGIAVPRVDRWDPGQSGPLDPSRLTDAGQVLGTVDYMAPEQALDTRRADERSDIYALGATLWFLLTGRDLFERDTVLKRILAHQHDPVPSLVDALGPQAADIDAVFQGMVAKDPRHRPQSMGEVIASLDRLPVRSQDPAPSGPTVRAPIAASGTPLAPPMPTEPPAAAVPITDDAVDSADRSWPEWAGIDTAPTPFPGAATPWPSDRPSAAVPAMRRRTVVLGTIGAAIVTALVIAMVASAARNRPPPTPPRAVAPFDAARAASLQQAWANHLGLPVTSTGPAGIRLVVVPPGAFTLGAPGGGAQVTISRPFLLGCTEVTQGQWREVMESEPWRGREHVLEGADVAVTMVSWEDAVEFCAALTRVGRAAGRLRAGQAYRLPTEAEWEYACRAGTVTAYSFGDAAAALDAYGWFGGPWDMVSNAPSPGGNTETEQHAHPVALKLANPWGLYDMHGNVWEWCADWHGAIAIAPAIDPVGAPSGDRRVFRGGGWNLSAASCTSAHRGSTPASRSNDNLGFRVALSPP